MSETTTAHPEPKKSWTMFSVLTLAAVFLLALLALYLRIDHLQQSLQRVEDVQSIERLQYAYNYYVEHMLKQEIIDCFADSPEVLLDWLEGKWKGKEGVRKYFDTSQVPPPGFLHQLIPSAGLITVSEDGKSAKGRWYAFGGVVMPGQEDAAGRRASSRSFINGIYEIGYTKENGVWKILNILWTIPYGVRIYDGWISPEDIAGPMLQNQEAPGILEVKPDVAMNPEDLRYVTGYILPFHFKHPVTGKPTSEGERNAQLKPIEAENK